MGVVLVSYGGGTNSTAVLCGMIERGEPAPHAILMADTGDWASGKAGEKPHTYEYRDMFSAWLVERGYPSITTIRKGGTATTLEEDCLLKNTLPAIAFGYKTCSQRYKTEPQEKWANNDPTCEAAWERGERVVKIIGFHDDEDHRAKPSPDPKYENRFPLIEWGWGQADCIIAIKRAGLPLPGKSACFFCPHSKPAEIWDLAERYPDLLDRALAMEANATRVTGLAGLGRRFRWRDLIARGKPAMQLDIFASYGEAPCECVDG